MKKKKFITIDALSLEFFGINLGFGFGTKFEKEVFEMLSPEEQKTLENAVDSMIETLKQITRGNKKLEAWILDREEPKEKDCENCDEKERCEKVKSVFEQMMEDLRK
ncbi:hypothetical protein [Proteiniclasticum sp.]|uniref:hypothetical protein n=1 Tax=Proteiniclasticum sp. TaxID=2053595 RepID=UPI00289CCC5B|nr:hypothetical protein [Proteiniclasticum sp.]